MIRKYALVFVVAVLCIGLIDCDGGGGGSSGSASNLFSSTSTIVGKAVKGPIEGAEVHVYYFDEKGNEVEVPAADGPVFTDKAGAFSFSVDGTDLMGITSPLFVRTEGGSMYDDDAPSMAAVIADPQPLTFARVTVSCPLSVASSVAAALLNRLAQSMGSAPLLEDAHRIIAQVEDQLKLDLSEDPADVRTRTGMLNECIDKNLDLPNTPGYNAAVEEFVDYLVANLSSSSGLLDDSMDDPYNPGTDTPASFTPFGTGLLSSIVGSDPAGFILMNLTSDVTYLENDWTDTAEITVTVRDAAGRPYQDLEAVQLGLVSGPGILWAAGLSYARGEVLAELTSDTSGDTGDILIQAICQLSNGNEISQEILIQALDFYVDGDGDGLPDGDEELGWDIAIDELGYGALATGALLTQRHVTSDRKLADTDSDGLSDYEEYLMRTDPRSVDTDGDGLTDKDEWDIWISNPTSVDTDGDGKTDFEEIDHPTRSPLVSDLPKLEMELVDAVDVRLDVTYAEEVGETYQYGSEMMKSTTRSHSNYEENSIEVGVEVKHSFGIFSSGTEASLKFGYGHKWSTTTEHSQTTQESHSKYVTDSRTRTETAASGSMTAGIRLRNTGNIAYTLSKMGIAVRHREQAWDENLGQLVSSFRTVATLVPSVGGGISLAPGEATPVLQVKATGLNTDRVKELLKRPDSLYLEDEYFELENAAGLSYAFLKEINLTRTASVLIDPGLGNAEAYRIATNVQRGAGGIYSGVTLGEILSGILDVDFATIGRKQVEPDSPSNERVLFRVRGLETNLTNPDLGFWAVVLQSENPPSGLYDFEEIPVKAGDRVLLVYVRDVDGDGVNDLLEQNSGTHDNDVSDYDGDGLSDYDEVIVGWHVKWTDSYGTELEYDVLSDPASADQDADGSNDLEEKTAGTDPSNPDTDRDGIPDRDDPAPLTQARVLYVDQNAEGDNNGSSWAHAYTDLQAALAEARLGYNNNADEPPNLTDDVAEIWVAQGVYIPSQIGDRTVPFVLVPTVGVYGGFRGGNEGSYPGETKRSQRDKDPRTNGTMLSGDLAGDDPDNDADNSNTVLIALEGGARHTVLDGFQIRGGNNTHTETWGNPGGMYVGRPLILKNLFFSGNRSLQGPGALTVRLWNEDEALMINRCVFTENQTINSNGGAILLYYNAGSVSLVECKLQGNTAPNGGAIYGRARQLTLMNTLITDNEALTARGGGIFIEQGTPAQIVNSKFTQNSAFYFGGGLYAQGNNDIQIIQSLFNENHTGAIGEGNWDQGGAIYQEFDCHLYMVNSTLIKNATDKSGDYSKGGGIYSAGNSTLRIENCILWGNDDNAPNDWFSNQIEGHRPNWTINTSCIQNYAGVANQISGFGNVSLCVAGTSDCDPLIDVDGTLKSGCACIDKGNNYVDFEPLTAGFQTLPEIDLAGEPRLVDGDQNGVADVDMGAYEHQP